MFEKRQQLLPDLGDILWNVLMFVTQFFPHSFLFSGRSWDLDVYLALLVCSKVVANFYAILKDTVSHDVFSLCGKKHGPSFILSGCIIFLSCSAPCGTGQTTIDIGYDLALLRNCVHHPADCNTLQKWNPITILNSPIVRPLTLTHDRKCRGVPDETTWLKAFFVVPALKLIFCMKLSKVCATKSTQIIEGNCSKGHF